MYLAVTIDVEEEGLFSGSYDPGEARVENVSCLRMLHPMFSDLGIRPTLLVTYQVARHTRHRELLMRLRDNLGGEIGAHLHHWNTPPYAELPGPPPAPSERIPKQALAAKLSSLMDSLCRMGADPVSFRMGRFNMGSRMFSLLEPAGIEVDTSVLPGRQSYAGPLHLSAPVDPYWPDHAEICRHGRSGVLEVPLTVVPAVPQALRLLTAVGAKDAGPGARLSALLQRLLLLPAQPAWTGLRRLKAAVRLHQRRGGKVLTVFFHSSELMPGGYPRHRTKEDVRRFLARVERFLSWLRGEIRAEPVTLSDLRQIYLGPIRNSSSRKGESPSQAL